MLERYQWKDDDLQSNGQSNVNCQNKCILTLSIRITFLLKRSVESDRHQIGGCFYRLPYLCTYDVRLKTRVISLIDEVADIRFLGVQ